jgi:hypothetical protein
MANKHKNDNHKDDVAADFAEVKQERNQTYEKAIARLHVEIAYLQSRVPASGARTVIRQGAVIKRVSPRGFPRGAGTE